MGDLVKNSVRFKNKFISVRTAVSKIIASTSLTGNLTKNHMHSSIEEFSILKKFRDLIHPCTSPKVIQVDWLPSDCGWIKVNFDGASRGSPGLAGGGAIFRDRMGQSYVVLLSSITLRIPLLLNY